MQKKQKNSLWLVFFIFLIVFTSMNTVYGGTKSAITDSVKFKPLRVPALSFPPKNLCPAKVADISNGMIINQLFQGLFSYYKEDLLTPQLLKKFSISPDGLRYEFELKKNVKFSNGEHLTAEKVVTSITNSILTLNESARWAFGFVNGFDQFIKSKNPDVFDFKAVDDYTIITTLETIFPPFLYVFAAPYFRIALKVNSNYIGTGPYIVTSRTDTVLSMKIMDSKKEETDIHHIEFKKIKNKNDIFSNEEYLNYDIVEILANRDIDSSQYKIYNFDFLQTGVAFFNTRDRVFSKKTNRKQFYLYLKKNIDFKKFGWQSTEKGLPFIMGLFNERKETLKAWRITALIEVIYADSVFTFDQREMDIVEHKLKNSGINVQFTRLSISELVKRLKQSNYQVAISGFLPDLLNMESLFSPLIETGQQYNFSGYSNTEVDSLIRKGREKRHFMSQHKIYSRIFEILSNDMPVGFVGSVVGKLILSKDYLLNKDNLHPFGLYMIDLHKIKRRRASHE
ncbi:MAG: ABC transporter substrate-binding protein [bacterium]|nr:ABC transporter substrate-binding protein [bacterium]